jgi:polysaccharide pyruvyl transferase WcaK-like protein
MIPYIDTSLAVLSVGGDNYSNSYGIPKIFTDLDDIVLENKKPLFLWGASIGPFNDDPQYQNYISQHLKNVTGIFARESVTKKYLDSIDVKDNVHLVADPAFVMEPVKPKITYENFFVDEEAIGFNISPLMARYATGGDIEKWTKIVVSILTRVSKDTDMPIYLIPHVTSPHSDDYSFMKTVLNKIEVKKNDIILIPPRYNAAETKWIISNMTIFAGARTHSTVASLSSCVPTLSFVYSIKGLGINDDIFGHMNYCIESKHINSENVSKKISDILDKSNEIKLGLSEMIPHVRNHAMSAGMHLKNLIDNNKEKVRINNVLYNEKI